MIVKKVRKPRRRTNMIAKNAGNSEKNVWRKSREIPVL